MRETGSNTEPGNRCDMQEQDTNQSKGKTQSLKYTRVGKHMKHRCTQKKGGTTNKGRKWKLKDDKRR